MLHESCCDCDYALYRICTSSAPYLSHQTSIRSGFASARPWTRTRDAKWMSVASRTLRTGTKRAVFTSLDIRGYIRKYSHWTAEEYLCRRIDLSPFHGAEESQEKKSRRLSDLEVDHARPRRTMNTAQSSAVFMSMDTRGYIEFYHQWTGEE